jgi:hypothetical protein
MRATIGFCDLHDAEGGLILAPTDFPMVFSEFTSEPDSGGESVCLRLARRDRVRSGASATYQAVFGVAAPSRPAAWAADHGGRTAMTPPAGWRDQHGAMLGGVEQFLLPGRQRFPRDAA